MKRAVLALEGSEAADEDDAAWVVSESGFFELTSGVSPMIHLDYG